MLVKEMTRFPSLYTQHMTNEIYIVLQKLPEG